VFLDLSLILIHHLQNPTDIMLSHVTFVLKLIYDVTIRVVGKRIQEVRWTSLGPLKWSGIAVLQPPDSLKMGKSDKWFPQALVHVPTFKFQTSNAGDYGGTQILIPYKVGIIYHHKIYRIKLNYLPLKLFHLFLCLYLDSSTRIPFIFILHTNSFGTLGFHS
jgi:hypothetical protein